MRVVVGMSGGVDSAVAAYLLKEQGYDVIGVTLRTWESGGSRCCEIDEARSTAAVLGIPYHVINCTPDFISKVQLPFIESYLQGQTPNPCILCNPLIKWEWMLYSANVHQADAVATGHYVRLAQLENGRYAVKQGIYKGKDQSYMLARLTQDQLSKSVFPLGEVTKAEVRQIAERAALPSAATGDSQEVCFVNSGTYADYICASTKDYQPIPGNYIDEEGRVLGKHKGIIYYTVGQRKGLHLAVGHPVYVKEIRPDTNEVVVVPEERLFQSEICCRDVVYQSMPDGEEENFRAKVKIRYHHEGESAVVEAFPDHTARVHFDKPVRAPAPGQTAVFYDSDNCVIAAGFIT